MKIFMALLFLLPSVSYAETVVLKDGNKIEADRISENGDTLLVQSKYGILNVNKSEVENLAALGLTGAAAAADPKADGLEFVTEQLPDNSVVVTYYSNRKKLGVQLFNQSGVIMNTSGNIPDATYREYYADGKIKKEKTLIDGQNNGVFKVYYPNGALQSETYFINGQINGGYKYYSDSGNLLIERSYVNGVPNGYFRDYDVKGAVKSQVKYVGGRVVGEGGADKVDPPVVQPEPVREEPSALSRSERETSLFIGGEVLSVADSNKEWKKNLQNAVDLLGGIYDYASGKIITYPGLAATIGVNFGSYKNSPVYIAGSYVKGPSADIEVNISDYYYGSGKYTEEITTSFYRLVVGQRRVFELGKHRYFALDINAGFSGGSVKSDRALYVTGVGASSGNSEADWTGITWSIGPNLAFEYPSHIWEIGFSYTYFPALEDDAEFSDIKWHPFTLRTSVLF